MEINQDSRHKDGVASKKAPRLPSTGLFRWILRSGKRPSHAACGTRRRGDIEAKG